MEQRQLTSEMIAETAEWLIKKLRDMAENEENTESRDLALRLLYEMVVRRASQIELLTPV